MDKSEYQDGWERKPGYVYFIAAGDPPKAIKIGVTVQSRLRQRLKVHQGSNHEPLYILKLIPIENIERPMLEAERLEREFHDKYIHLQRFEKGWVGSEWFTAAEELLDAINLLGQSPQELGEIATLAKISQGMSFEANKD